MTETQKVLNDIRIRLLVAIGNINNIEILLREHGSELSDDRVKSLDFGTRSVSRELDRFQHTLCQEISGK